MKSKNLLILCIVFILLLAMTFVKKNMTPRVPTSEQLVDIVEHDITAEAINECKITFKEKEIHLSKDNGTWIVKNHYGAYADEQKLISLFDKLDKVEGELRSGTEALLIDYGISDEQALHIKLSNDSAEITHLLLGAKRSGREGNFFRHNRSNSVYLVNEDILRELGFWRELNEENLNIERWLDKRVVYFNEDNVISIKITKEQQAVVELSSKMEDNQKQWKTAKEYRFKIDSSKITNFMRTVSNLKAKTIISSDIDGGFDLPSWELLFALGDENRITITRGKRDDTGDNYYVKTSDASYAFFVPVTAFNNLLKTDGDFFVNNPLEINDNNFMELKVDDIEKNRKIAIIKSSEKEKVDEANKTASDIVIWKSPEGKMFNPGDVKDMIRELQKITIKTIPLIPQSVENILAISITKENELAEYEVSKSISFDDGQEYHLLRIKNDTQMYCVGTNEISAIRSVILSLEEKKATAPLQEEPATVKNKGL